MLNSSDQIIIKGARQHNLKNINLSIPRNKLVVITGLSGSGKSSLAFDTIYAEGQRRYVESLSAYARQFLGLMEKPNMDSIEGLSPAIAIEQKATARNPRSTVGTVTEIHDYLRLLFSHLGIPHCWKCGSTIKKQSAQQIVDLVSGLEKNTKLEILSPVIRGKKGVHKGVFEEIKKEGFVRLRVDGELYKIADIQKLNLDKNKKHDIDVVIDRLIMKDNADGRLNESIELALKIGNGIVKIKDSSKRERVFSENFSCPSCGTGLEEIVPRVFSFNSPYGACHKCDGLGSQMEVDPNIIVPDKSKSLIQGAIEPLGEQPRNNWYGNIIKSLANNYKFSFTTPWIKLDPIVRQILLYGTKDQLEMKYKSDRWSGIYTGAWEGVIPNLMRRYKQTKSQSIRNWIEQFMSLRSCSTCKGMRLRKESLHITFKKKNIGELSSMSIKDLFLFFENLKLTKVETEISEQILKEIKERLRFLINVGLDYLSLDRSAITLSGGEAQRIRLATQIGSQLVGVLYILDEPSIGLHPRDNTRLLETLKLLRDIGNSILVVEHDSETIQSADFVVDIGPRAGENGGEVVFAGQPQEIKNSPESLTGQFLTGKKTIDIPKRRKVDKINFLRLKGATGNNLKSIDVKFPLCRFITVTGVSGSGKSTLINETLLPALSKGLNKSRAYPLHYDSIDGLRYLAKVISIDQKPIGRTPRSNPATYTGIFTYIRDLFAKLPESKIRGYKPGRFSFNVKGGRCESCQGDGIIKIEMNFLPDVYITCDICKGKRYNKKTNEVKYRSKSISDVLDMSVFDAFNFFENIPNIKKKLKTLCDVGLGYIRLGQQATTLSGGEAQRIKLATELSKISNVKTLYILDEPTTGLHFEDIRLLLKVLQRLVDRGNTVIVIEHNLDVIKSSDWVIDLGPEGGDLGGNIIAKGTPEQLSLSKSSYTGLFLKKELKYS